MRVCVPITSRPAHARLWRVLDALDTNPKVELHVITAGSANLDRYGGVSSYLYNFRVESIDAQVEGDHPATMAVTTGSLTEELANAFKRISPDVVLAHADRYETLSVAIAANYQNIPLAHTQGGETTGSVDNSVRWAVTMLANLHFPATKAAREALIWSGRYDYQGRREDRVVHTGCPGLDGISRNDDVEGRGLLVILHPDTRNLDESFRCLQAVANVAGAFKRVAWVYPNIDAGGGVMAKEMRRLAKHQLSHVDWIKTIEPTQFIAYAQTFRCVLGNSSFGIRECSYLGLPSVDVGGRQRPRERARNAVNVDANEDAIHEAISNREHRYESSDLYHQEGASAQIARLLAEPAMWCLR